MQLIKQVKSFGGVIKQYVHESTSTKCRMKFSIFLPPTASDSHKVPVLFYLPGLTCNDELLFIKAPEAQKVAANRGIAIVTMDTSPRDVTIAGDNDTWDFGTGAGFYVDATEPKWENHYRMYSYVNKELPALVLANFPIMKDKQSIMGHSMGGHGALVLGIRNSTQYKSISAFAPIAHPSQCPWGIKAFTGYLGVEQETWKEYDATQLILKQGPITQPILIDQGREDNFLHDKQLLPEAFEAACNLVGQEVTLRMQDGYDHSYYFIASFIEDHVNYHADALLQ
ncbi:hypothetical protein KXD40_000510 [Peronospora effusa]|uniref:S-formylglutathione hydrolase n=1 Tax=Peronospora effusa TaxID=542832 RepID=A0A3M6VI06_9STRA|nr:hypothetical protein DD238_002562 [Peronospora effusa]RQM14401.1 hypothetical protein DD237_004689 [Peronospora effusa]UIZ21191.1 hypothetical protein KXD40_000510 [Peronospora effusa]CAI5702142.1 unnamed protein product [Peronospora effusa]